MSPIIRVQHWLAHWVQTWPRREPWKDVPVILAFLLSLYFIYTVAFWKPMSVRSRYARFVHEELGEGNFQTALVASHRLLEIDSSWRNQAIFGMALAHQGLGHRDKALEFMRMVAPPDRPVYAPAHLYAATSLMRKPTATHELLPFIIAQLNQVLALEPNSVEVNKILRTLYSSQEDWSMPEKHFLAPEPQSIEANEILGSLYSSQKEWALAEKHFSAVINEKPEYMLLLARIAKERNNTKAAENWTYDALVHFQKAVNRSASDNPKNRIPYLEALMMRNEVEKAKAVLDEGRKLSGDEPYKQVIPGVCAVLAKQLAAKDPGDLDARIRLIREGMEANPKSSPLLVQLLELSEQNGAESQAAGSRILKMLDNKNVWPPLFFVGAKISWSREAPWDVRKYLEQACSLDPGGAVLANNLAVAGGSSNRACLPFALELVQFALEKRPDDPDIRMTRGVTLTRLSRVQEGISDLQYSLEHTDDKAAVHRSLAGAYLSLGLKNLAMEHFLFSTPKPSPSPAPTRHGPAGKPSPRQRAAR